MDIGNFETEEDPKGFGFFIAIRSKDPAKLAKCALKFLFKSHVHPGQVTIFVDSQKQLQKHAEYLRDNPLSLPFTDKSAQWEQCYTPKVNRHLVGNIVLYDGDLWKSSKYYLKYFTPLLKGQMVVNVGYDLTRLVLKERQSWQKDIEQYIDKWLRSSVKVLTEDKQRFFHVLDKQGKPDARFYGEIIRPDFVDQSKCTTDEVKVHFQSMKKPHKTKILKSIPNPNPDEPSTPHRASFSSSIPAIPTPQSRKSVEVESDSDFDLSPQASSSKVTPSVNKDVDDHLDFRTKELVVTVEAGETLAPTDLQLALIWQEMLQYKTAEEWEEMLLKQKEEKEEQQISSDSETEEIMTTIVKPKRLIMDIKADEYDSPDSPPFASARPLRQSKRKKSRSDYDEAMKMFDIQDSLC